MTTRQPATSGIVRNERRGEQQHRRWAGNAPRDPVQSEGNNEGETEPDGSRQHEPKAANAAGGGDQELKCGSRAGVGGQQIDHLELTGASTDGRQDLPAAAAVARTRQHAIG